jgi:hypothetical protein
MVILGYALLALAALAAHFCALRPQVPEEWLLRLVRRFKPPRRQEIYVPYFEVIEGA